MKHILAVVLMGILGVGLTMAAVVLLVGATFSIAQIENPLFRALAVLAELILGVLLLVGTVYLTTRLAVRAFAGKSRGSRE